MLRLIFPIFAAISLQASFHVNAADNMLPAEDVSHVIITKKYLKEKEQEDVVNFLESTPYYDDSIYDDPGNATAKYNHILLSPNPTLKQLRKAASAFTFAFQMEKAWEARIKIVQHQQVTLDDWADLLLSFTFPAGNSGHSTSHLEAYRKIIKDACQKLKNTSEIRGNSITRFELKKAINNAKNWLKYSFSHN